MATAEELRKEFTDLMDQEDVAYTIFNTEDNIVSMAFVNGDGPTTTLHVDFDEDGDNSDSVHFVAHRVAKCSKEKIPAVILKVNDVNKRFRWCKFHVDIDDDFGWIDVYSDAQVYPGTVGIECVECAFRMASIIEDAIEMLGDLVEESDFGEILHRISVLRSSL